tara:strand:+ start:1442 stop:3553 length:2112 start_codon:yes stop_codon:yes gene_type:complete
LGVINEVAQVQISPDNGSTWHTVATSQDTQTSEERFTLLSADLSPYILDTSTQAKIRFYMPWTVGNGDYMRVGRIWIHESDVPTNLGGMWLGAAGKIGIGTTTPATALEVNGDIGIGRVAGGYTFREVVGGGVRATIKSNATNDLILSTGGDSEALRILNNGNVGIGTNDPQVDLEIENVNGSPELRFTDPFNGSVASWDARSNVLGEISWYSRDVQLTNSYAKVASITSKHFDDGFPDGALCFTTSSNGVLNEDAMVIDHTGNVGIGTTSPSKLLEISGASGLDNSSPVHFRITNTQSATNGSPFTDITKPAGLISFYTTDSSTAGPGDVAGIGFRPESELGGNTALCFYTDSNSDDDPVQPLQERMCITHDGNVGIGTDNPVGVNGGRRLEGSSSTGFEYIATRDDTAVANNDFIGGYLIKGTDTSGTEPHYAGMSATANGVNSYFNLNFFSGRDNYENDTPQMTIDPDGNVGIGTDSPNGLLDILGPMDEGQHKLRLRDSNTNLTFRLGLKPGSSGYQTGWTTIDPNSGGGLAIYDVLYVSGTLSVTSTKNFLIDHPLQPTTKKLIHTAVESPRVDLIYRGTTQLKDGRAIVNIDRQCVGDESCAMEDGTFEALCRDPVYYLQNTTDFNRLIGTIDKNLLTVISEDVNSIATVNWMVVAERKDRDIVEATQTNDNGRLNTEIIDTSERVNRDGSERYSSA